MTNYDEVVKLLISNFSYMLKYRDRKRLYDGEVYLIVVLLKKRLRAQTIVGFALGCLLLIFSILDFFNPSTGYSNFMIGIGGSIWLIYFVHKQNKRSQFVITEAELLTKKTEA